MIKSNFEGNMPFDSTKNFKYSITYTESTEESSEYGDYSDQGYEVERQEAEIGDILHQAHSNYGIYSPTSLGSWESTSPLMDRNHFEKGVDKYFQLHVMDVDGSPISEKEHDFITHLLSEGKYHADDFEEYGFGGLLKDSRWNRGLSYKLDRAKFNKNEKYEVPMGKRSFKDGGGVDEKVYIKFMNKDKGFKRDMKEFDSYEEAIEWGKKNIDNFNTDMVNYKFKEGGIVNFNDFGFDSKEKYWAGNILIRAEISEEKFDDIVDYMDAVDLEPNPFNSKDGGVHFGFRYKGDGKDLMVLLKDFSKYLKSNNIKGEIYEINENDISFSEESEKIRQLLNEKDPSRKADYSLIGKDVIITNPNDENGNYDKIGKIVSVIEPSKSQLSSYNMINYVISFPMNNENNAYLREEFEINSNKFKEGGSVFADMSEKEFLKEYFGVNTFTSNPSEYFDIKKMSSSSDSKIDAFIDDLKSNGYSIKKKSYSDFTSVMGVKKKSSFKEGGAVEQVVGTYSDFKNKVVITATKTKNDNSYQVIVKRYPSGENIVEYPRTMDSLVFVKNYIEAIGKYTDGEIGIGTFTEWIKQNGLDYNSLVSYAEKNNVIMPKYVDGGGVEKSYNNPEKSTHVLNIDGYNWYLEKIDGTHFYMSNSADFRGMAHHIGQHKGEPYYEEIRQWLADTKTDKFAGGGGVDAYFNYEIIATNKMGEDFVVCRARAFGDVVHIIAGLERAVNDGESVKYSHKNISNKKYPKNYFNYEVLATNKMGEEFVVCEARAFGDVVHIIAGLERAVNDGESVKYSHKRLGNSKFAGGGSAGDISYEEILDVLKESIDDSIEELPREYEQSENFKGEEVESKSRDGFMAFTNGGYEATWFEYISQFSGSGNSLPTAQLDKEMQRQVDYQYENAKDRFKDEYPEIVEELGEENIDYNSLNEAGYESEAEQLSEWEMDFDGDDSIMCEIGAYYYDTENYRGIDGEHTIRLFGVVNLESPYHRRGNLEDSYDIDITFNSIEELKEKVAEGLKEIISWFDGKMYNDSKSELGIKRMAGGGSAGEVSKAEGIKNEMYKAFESYLSNKTSDAQLVSKLERILGKRKWFRFYEGDTLASTFSTVKRALSERVNREGERENMQLALDERGLKIYDYDGNEMFAGGGSAGEINIGDEIYLMEVGDGYQIYPYNNDDYEYGARAINLDGTNERVFGMDDVISIIGKENWDSYTKYKSDENRQSFRFLPFKSKKKIPLDLNPQGKDLNPHGKKKFAGGGGLEDDGDIITFDDGLQFQEVSEIFAQNNWNNKDIYGINKEDQTERLIEREHELDRFSIFGTKIGYAKRKRFNDGGGVDEDGEWLSEALESLKEHTDDDSLTIDSSNNDNANVIGDSGEYTIYRNEDLAEQDAIEKVKEDLQENAEYFNEEWLMGHISAESFFENLFNEWNMGYATDIMTEDDSIYGNRLIAEMVEWGIMDSDEANSRDAEETANERIEDFVQALTEDQINQGNEGLTYYIDNFGKEDAMKVVVENNLIDMDSASKDAVNVDGIGHFLSSYDGNTIYLENNSVAFRTN